MSKINSGEIAAVVLAGGKGLRMAGRNKLYLPFGEQTLLARTLGFLQSQCEFSVLNCNESVVLPADLSGLTKVADKEKGTAGPLDGLVSTMEWLHANTPQYRWLLSVPADCPFLPADLLRQFRLKLDAEPAQIAVASYAGRQHFTCALWSLALAGEGRAFIRSDMRALKHFIANYQYVEVEFAHAKIDPFFNINTPEDYENALALLK